MPDLIERVARAICIGMAHDPDAPMLDEGPSWKKFIPAARAATDIVAEECAQAMDAFGLTTMTGEYAAMWLRSMKGQRS